MVKVSIVIPVYNVKRYLPLCIESVINQTIKEIEIICVNDGSTDGSKEILEEYAEKDDRIIIINQENGGYGKAMNAGFKVARGEYVGIVESDDWIMANMYETLYQTAIDYNLEIVKSDYCKFYDYCIIRRHQNELEQYYNRVLTEKEKNFFFEFDMFNWTGIYKNDFIRENNIVHYETPGASYQDTGFWLRVMSACKRAMWLSETFYMYRQDNITSSTKSKGKMLNHKLEYDWFERDTNYKDLIPVMNYFRLNIYRFDFYRIDVSLRAEYADIIIKDYEERKNAIKFSDESKIVELKAWYSLLIKNPDKFIINAEEEANLFIKSINSYDKIILYGTGARGMETYAKFKSLGIDNKLIFTINTNKTDENFFELKIYTPDILDKYSDALVLISVCKGTTVYDEIENKIKSLGIANYCNTEYITRI